MLKRLALPAASTASGTTLSRAVRLSTDWLRPPKRLRRAAVALPVAEAMGVTRVVLPPLELGEGAAEDAALPTCRETHTSSTVGQSKIVAVLIAESVRVAKGATRAVKLATVVQRKWYCLAGCTPNLFTNRNNQYNNRDLMFVLV